MNRMPSDHRFRINLAGPIFELLVRSATNYLKNAAAAKSKQKMSRFAGLQFAEVRKYYLTVHVRGKPIESTSSLHPNANDAKALLIDDFILCCRLLQSICGGGILHATKQKDDDGEFRLAGIRYRENTERWGSCVWFSSRLASVWICPK